MLQQFAAGDFLIFQLESGYALLHILAVYETGNDLTWHLAAYNELFMDVDSAEAAISAPGTLTQMSPHLALTNRAFESTPVATIANSPLTESDLSPLREWRNGSDRNVHDRSIRLLLGLR